MKRDWLLYLVIFSLALNLGTIGTLAYWRLQEQPTFWRTEPPPPPTPWRELWNSLGLSPSQRRALRSCLPEHHRQVRTLRLAMAQKRQELFALIKQEPENWAAVQGKIGEIKEVQGRLEEELVGLLLKIKKQLTPEQKAAFLGLLEKKLLHFMGGPFPAGHHPGRRCEKDGRHGPGGPPARPTDQSP